MRLISLLGLAGLIAEAIAQTPPSSVPTTNNNLPVRYGSTNVTPGLRLTKEASSTIPTISHIPTAANQTFILFLIDISIPATVVNTSTLNATTQLPLAPGLGPNRTTLLHFQQTGLKFAQNGTLQNSTAPTAVYVGPNPPAGDIAHDYVWYLFEQQAIFRAPTAAPYTTTERRLSFNLANFTRNAGVGPLVAANYIVVQNNATANATGTASATTASRTGSATASVAPFRGGAGTIAKGVEGAVAVVFAAGLAALML